MNCPGCGKEIPDVYAGVRCPSCGAPLTPGAGAPGAPRPEAAGIPWENRNRLGFFPSLFGTMRACLFEASDFFENMPKRENLGSAIGYILLLGWIGALGGILWNVLLQGAQHAALRNLGMQPPAAMPAAIGFAVYAGLIVLFPLILLLALFIWSAILHVVLWILGGAKEGFEATVRVYCYAAGSTAIFQWVPICGGLVGFIWSLVLQIIGLARVHQIGTGKAAVAVLLPLALCCALLLALCIAFAGFFLAAMRGAAA